LLSRYRKELNLRFDAIARRITFISPNTLTLLNLLFSLVPGFLYYTRHFQLAGISLLIFSALDVLDGAVARVTDSVSAFGGFLDSTVDRVADFVILGSIALSQVVDWRIVLFAAFGSFMVPYCRARGEAAGSTEMAVGIAERAERQLFLVAVSIVHPIFQTLNLLQIGIAVLGILAWITVIQRVVAAKRTLGG